MRVYMPNYVPVKIEQVTTFEQYEKTRRRMTDARNTQELVRSVVAAELLPNGDGGHDTITVFSCEVYMSRRANASTVTACVWASDSYGKTRYAHYRACGYGYDKIGTAIKTAYRACGFNFVGSPDVDILAYSHAVLCGAKAGKIIIAES